MSRQPRDGVKVTRLTEARMVQAAHELGTTVAEMTERACIGLLKHQAKQLFEREFSQAQQEAAGKLNPTVQREDFAASWKAPAWKP